MAQTILVVDDEPSIVEVLSLYLSREGYSVLSADNGETALNLAREARPDLIVLDIMLPYKSGLEVTSLLRREHNIPIILLTARSDEIDRIAGLEIGADDYVVKPFSPREVVARVKAVLRRAAVVEKDLEQKSLAIGGIVISPGERSVTLDDRQVSLTAKEFDLLYFLASQPRHVFSRSQLLDHVWGTEFIADESTVTVHVRRLREKIEIDASHPTHVVTVWGVGYKFDG
ncbi:MAG: response regulator transcription factor [Chloroflexia bacterium]|nr:response regulator transcription factor [Chloroflexia bacterium]